MWIFPFLWTQIVHADVNQMQVVLNIDDSIHTRLKSLMLAIQDRVETPLLEISPGFWQGSDHIPRSNSLDYCIVDMGTPLICPGLAQVPNQDVITLAFETQAGTPVLEKVGPDQCNRLRLWKKTEVPLRGLEHRHQNWRQY